MLFAFLRAEFALKTWLFSPFVTIHLTNDHLFGSKAKMLKCENEFYLLFFTTSFHVLLDFMRKMENLN